MRQLVFVQAPEQGGVRDNIQYFVHISPVLVLTSPDAILNFVSGRIFHPLFDLSQGATALFFLYLSSTVEKIRRIDLGQGGSETIQVGCDSQYDSKHF
jgi:hypothetical protein